MHKALLFISRFMLTLGVMVALTPCGLCQAAMEKPAQACAMKPVSGKMDCCHKNKQASPICKAMGQSSTAAVSHGLDLAVVPVVAFASSLEAMPSRVVLSIPVVLDTSPLRAPLSLRI